MKNRISGVITALVTPFDQTGAIDWKAWQRLLTDQIAAGVSGVVPCGTTGESPTLETEEKKQLISTAIDQCRNTPVAVIAGTGGASTRDTVDLSEWASKAGADAVLVVTPYYNKPSQDGLLSHYRAVAAAVSCPVVLYNVPGRTGVGLEARTIAALAAHPRIRQIKEATGNPAFASEIQDRCARTGSAIDVLSGDDATWLPLLAAGASGVISVASNLFPRAMVELQRSWGDRDFDRCLEIHRLYYPLFRDLFVESNPAPIKHALGWAGLCGGGMRAPLAALSEASARRLEESLLNCGFTSQGGTR